MRERNVPKTCFGTERPPTEKASVLTLPRYEPVTTASAERELDRLEARGEEARRTVELGELAVRRVGGRLGRVEREPAVGRRRLDDHIVRARVEGEAGGLRGRADGARDGDLRDGLERQSICRRASRTVEER